MSLGYDPTRASYTSNIVTKYCTPTDDDPAFAYPYAGTTLTELSPVGIICEPGTLAVTPTTW